MGTFTSGNQKLAKSEIDFQKVFILLLKCHVSPVVKQQNYIVFFYDQLPHKVMSLLAVIIYAVILDRCS